MNDVSVTEGNRGRTPATFTVTLSRPLSSDTTVCLVPFGLTALPVLDFDLSLACGTLAAGDTSVDLSVSVKGDRARERNETFGVLALATNGVHLADPVGLGTIVNDD